MNSAQMLDSILADLKVKQANAAKRCKPTMWGYYLSQRRALNRWFGTSRNPGGVAGKALALIQCAETHYNDKDAQRAAHWAAQAVYASKIFRCWVKGHKNNLDWLRARAEED